MEPEGPRLVKVSKSGMIKIHRAKCFFCGDWVTAKNWSGSYKWVPGIPQPVCDKEECKESCGISEFGHSWPEVKKSLIKEKNDHERYSEIVLPIIARLLAEPKTKYALFNRVVKIARTKGLTKGQARDGIYYLWYAGKIAESKKGHYRLPR